MTHAQAVIVVITKVLQLPFEISGTAAGTPECNLIEQLSPFGSEYSLNERMR
jgi:hypothetical protein